MVDILVGGRGEVELLCGDTIVTGAAESQGPFKVKQLAHEVEVGRDVGLLHFDNVISIVHGQVELLHKVSHCHRDGAADARQAMHQDTTVFASGFIYERNGLREKLGQVLAPVIRDRNLLVLELPAFSNRLGRLGVTFKMYLMPNSSNTSKLVESLAQPR